MLKLDKSLVRICLNIYISIARYNLFRNEMSPILKAFLRDYVWLKLFELVISKYNISLALGTALDLRHMVMIRNISFPHAAYFLDIDFHY